MLDIKFNIGDVVKVVSISEDSKDGKFFGVSVGDVGTVVELDDCPFVEFEAIGLVALRQDRLTLVEPKYTAEHVKVELPIINHKVEQLVRALYWGLGSNGNTLRTKVEEGSAQTYFGGGDWVEIGIADHKGYRLHPETNSVLTMMGYHANAVLYHLTSMRLHGEPVVAAKGDKLIAMHAAVVNCAHDVMRGYDVLVTRKVKGKYVPQVVARPILERYLHEGKPKLFA